jgi:cyclopropane fatty-acyl-phospholipid synthase-like methyltransferase
VNSLHSHVVFQDPKLEGRFATGKIPMATLYEAYLDGDVDIPDMDAFLDARDELVTYRLSKPDWRFLLGKFLPQTLHSKSQDERLVRDHYDRGNDFFEAFLGDRMVYTSGFFQDADESLEQGQDQKMDLVCRKLLLQKGQRMLDIGCGWGTLAMFAAQRYGADTTGVTISKNQTEFGNRRMEKNGVSSHARVVCQDYREIPHEKFDRISSLEMVEHVGIKNLPSFCELVYDRLADDGVFLLQWTGLRRGGPTGLPLIGLRPEDMIWGLFMNKYIFEGADASLPLSDMCRYLENAGFEIHSAENVSIHYSFTIKKWHDNWQKNHDTVVKAYGERWYRLWHLFLAWSWRIAKQGNAACFQIVAHKNLDHYDRKVFVGRQSLGSVRLNGKARVPEMETPAVRVRAD